MKYSALFFVVAMACTTAVAGSPVITVDVNREEGRINPLISGHNIEAGDDRGINSPANLPKPSPDCVNTGRGHWDSASRCSDPAALREYAEVGCRLLRYPGGCIVHNFDWRKAVGRLEERPDWKFGLNEFLTFCRDAGVEPMITFTDYAVAPEELPKHCAELVEYLNMPARPEYPQAMKRARDGYENPWHVRYFEFGNESFHGNHSVIPFRCFTAESYAAAAKEVIAAVKGVDPSIQVGTLAMNGMAFADAENPWVTTIFRELIPVSDFITIHYYGPKLERMNPSEALAAGLTGRALFRYRLEKTQELMKRHGGKVLPISVNEFNVGAMANLPPHWRHSFLGALLVTDLLMELRRPESRIHSAAYWQLIGGYFGAVQRRNGERVKGAAYPFWREFAGGTGDTLLAVSVEGNPRREQRTAKWGCFIAAGDRFLPVRNLGKITNFRFFDAGLRSDGIRGKIDGPARMRFQLANEKDCYPGFMGMRRSADIPEGRGYSVILRFEARYTPSAENPDSGTFSLGFGLMDARGWEATRCASGIGGFQKSAGWTPYSLRLSVGGDCEDIVGLLRINDVHGKCNGVLEFRNLTGEIIADCQLPAIELLGVEATAIDSRTAALAVINRSPDEAVAAEIVLPGSKIERADCRELYQEDVSSSLLFEARETREEPQGERLSHTFPPHSLTIFRITHTVGR